MTVERREEKVGKPLLTGSALGGDKFRDICDMETIPPETDVLINNAHLSFKAIFNVHFANLVSKDYFSIQRLIIFLLYE